MKIEFKLNGLQVTPEKYDFNWAKVSFSRLQADKGDVDILINIEVKVPKKHNNLDEIKKHAFDQALFEIKQCANFFSDEQHQ
jgi:hypothetical protein